jgi:hypothetical protein
MCFAVATTVVFSGFRSLDVGSVGRVKYYCRLCSIIPPPRSGSLALSEVARRRAQIMAIGRAAHLQAVVQAASAVCDVLLIVDDMRC